MAITFAVRGDSLTARYAGGSPVGEKQNAPVITVDVDASALSGSVINKSNTTANSFVYWNGYQNMFDGPAFSILMRFRAGYTGAPAAARGLFELGFINVAGGPIFTAYHGSNAQMAIVARNALTENPIANTASGTFLPGSSVYYDFVITHVGTTAANSTKLYFDAALFSSLTPVAVMGTTLTSRNWPSIAMGFSYNAPISALYLDEMVIWNEVIDPAAVQLVGGVTGPLSGAGRTLLVDVSSFNGSVYTNPGATMVQIGQTYSFAGVGFTGTYTGSDRWSDPGESNVKLGVEYQADSTTDNKTGTYAPSSGGGHGTSFLGKKRISSSRA